MPVGTITKRYDNPTNIRVTFDNDREKTYSTNKKNLYDILEEGATIEYTVEQNKGFWNIATAVPATRAAVEPASARPTAPTGADGQSWGNAKNVAGNMIAFLVEGVPAPEETFSAWHYWATKIYYAEPLPPLVAEAVRQGGQLKDDV
jgi:hypothetical protein